MSPGIFGAGVWVRMRIVAGSMTSTARIARTAPPYPPGLFGTLGARAREKATSSDVSLLPSWNTTPGRRLNSQVVSSTDFQLSASHGMSMASGVRLVSRSKTCEATVALGAALKKCGSMDVAGAARPMRRSAAWAAETEARTANAVAQRCVLRCCVIVTSFPLRPDVVRSSSCRMFAGRVLYYAVSGGWRRTLAERARRQP